MTQQEFLLQLKALRAKYSVQLLTGIEYNRELLRLHADHASALLVEQPGPKPVTYETSADMLARSQAELEKCPNAAALPLGLSYAHTEWARQHDWYVRRGLDNYGYFVVVRDLGAPGTEELFRDYNALRAWAGY